MVELSKILNFPKKKQYTILSSFEMKISDYFHENLAEQVVNSLVAKSSSSFCC